MFRRPTLFRAEMPQLLIALRIALPLLYAALVAVTGDIFFRPGAAVVRLKRARPLVLIVLTFHALYIGAYTVYEGHCLLATIFELGSLIAFTLLAIYAFVEMRITSEASGTGFLVSTVAFLFQTSSSLFIDTASTIEHTAILKNPLFNIHVTTAVFGYAALTLSMIYGTLYLLLFRAMRKNLFGPVYEHLPSLERLERYGIRTTAVGFVFLSISIVIGGLLLGDSSGIHGMALDPKIIATVLVWLIFGLTLIIRRIARIEGRKLVLFWMCGFALMIISMTLVNAFVTSFHNFL
jgi:HemX protein